VRFKDFLSDALSEVSRELLPSHAKLLGGVALIRIRPELDHLEKRIGELALEFYRVRSVYRVYGVEGVERRPALKHLAGEPVKDVLHKEYGCIFKLNLTKLMFCLGNSFERLRMAALTRSGEVVVDMFAGVGQFTIPIAVLSDPRKIYAIEINPEAYRYLLENIKLNRVEDKVEAVLGDCGEVVPERLREKADRIIMGYFGGTLRYLQAALTALKKHGGVIHLHELVRRGAEEEFVRAVIREAEDNGYVVRLITWRKVKSYSKTRNHVVIDFFAVRA